MKKKISTLKTDAKAERFVGTADLSKYDLSGLQALKMKNPPHPGFSVRLDCLEANGLSVTDGAKVLGVSRSAQGEWLYCYARPSRSATQPNLSYRQGSDVETASSRSC